MAITFYNGVIADTPATSQSTVKVSTPDLQAMDRQTFGPATFRVNILEDGQVDLPQRGDPCLFAQDTAGKVWIVSWESASPPALGLLDPNLYAARLTAEPWITGGGFVTFDKNLGLAWSQRFIAIADGMDTDTRTIEPTSGWHGIPMPPNGTVIQGVGGHSNVTVASGRIPIVNQSFTWEALYFIINSSSNGSNGAFGNFRIGNWGAGANYRVPQNWVKIAQFNSDVNENRIWVVGHGFVDYVHYIGDTGEPPFQNSWINFDNSAATPGTPGQRSAAFYKDNGNIVHLQGVIKTGANGTTAFTLPTNYRPVDANSSQGYTSVASSGVALLSIGSAGTVTPSALTTGAAVTTYTFLDGVSFLARQ